MTCRVCLLTPLHRPLRRDLCGWLIKWIKSNSLLLLRSCGPHGFAGTNMCSRSRLLSIPLLLVLGLLS